VRNISAINSEEKPRQQMFYVFMWCAMLSCAEALQWDLPLPFSWHFLLDVLKDYLLHNLIHNQPKPKGWMHYSRRWSNFNHFI